MRLSRLLLAAALIAAVNAAGRADDTEEFLKPENWEGRADLWKLDPKARTIVGETTEDPKYNTFFCTKAKYGDFELSCKVLLRDGVGNSGIQVRSEVLDSTFSQARSASKGNRFRPCWRCGLVKQLHDRPRAGEGSSVGCVKRVFERRRTTHPTGLRSRPLPRPGAAV
jgi:hypothetical protein